MKTAPKTVPLSPFAVLIGTMALLFTGEAAAFGTPQIETSFFDYVLSQTDKIGVDRMAGTPLDRWWHNWLLGFVTAFFIGLIPSVLLAHLRCAETSWLRDVRGVGIILGVIVSAALLVAVMARSSAPLSFALVAAWGGLLGCVFYLDSLLARFAVATYACVIFGATFVPSYQPNGGFEPLSMLATLGLHALLLVLCGMGVVVGGVPGAFGESGTPGSEDLDVDSSDDEANDGR